MNVPASTEVTKRLEDIKNRTIEVLAEFHLLEMETQKVLTEESQRLGIQDVVESFNFQTSEFVIKESDSTTLGGD